MDKTTRFKAYILRYIEKNSFITQSFFITIIFIVLWFMSDYHTVLFSIGLGLQSLNVTLSILCRLQKKHSPYRTVLVVVNTATFIMLSIFYFYTPLSFDVNHILTKQLYLNAWDWIAFILGGITLIFAACTWSSQEQTQKNTLQITSKGQYSLLTDSVRDAYRNLSLLYALEYRLKGLSGQYYPSDELFLRMCSDDRFIYPSLFADDYEKCRRLQRFRVNVRNANIELRVIADRFKDHNMKPELHDDDIRVIKDRIDDNLRRLRELLEQLWGYDEKQARELRAYIKTCAADCNDNKDEYSKLFAEANKKFDNGELQYFYTGLNKNGKCTELLNLLFKKTDNVAKNSGIDANNSDKETEAEFLRKLNLNIYADAHLYGRIRLIPYDNSKPLILN